jgi:hypothetical protein
VASHPATKLIINGPWPSSHRKAVRLASPSLWAMISIQCRRTDSNGSPQWFRATKISETVDEGIRRAGRKSLCVTITSNDEEMDEDRYDGRWIPAVVQRIPSYATVIPCLFSFDARTIRRSCDDDAASERGYSATSYDGHNFDLNDNRNGRRMEICSA